MIDEIDSSTKKKNNIIVTFFKSIYLVILDIINYAFKGIKFLTIDMFNKVTGKTTKSNGTKKVTKLSQKREEKLELKRQALLKELQEENVGRDKVPKVYWYRVKNKYGKIETGTINGYSKLDVNTFLVQEGFTAYEIRNDKMIEVMYGESSIFGTRMSNKDLLFWLTQLSTYIKSGISLIESIKILNNQMRSKKQYRKAFQSIVYELTIGESFSKALEKQGNIFPALLINMIRAAEATGELEGTLTDMSNYYEEIEKTRKQMISAIMYPSIILVFAIAVITFILMYVIPQFVQIYEEAGAQLNGLTLFIINFSNFLKNNIIFIIVIMVIIFLAIVLCYRNIKAFRKNVQYVLMHTPIISKVIIYNEMTIFTKTFSSLLANNVFITDSMDILSRITNNEIYKEIMEQTIKNIVKGDKISNSFKDHWAVPDVAYYMIVTGESTGQLAEMMKRVSDYYAEMHRSIVTNLKAFIEPVLISMLAFVVGVIILAVLLPMFGLLDQFDV